MLLAGDELSHTQEGNNNTYCQDNELTWLDWELDEPQQRFLEFVRGVVRIWKDQPVFQRRKFLQGRAIRGTDIKDISWLGPDGEEMSDEAWNAGFVKCLGVRLAGDLIDEVDDRGEPLAGDTLLLLLNAHHEPISFTLPAARTEHSWERLLDTATPGGDSDLMAPGDQYPLEGRSLAVLRTRAVEDAAAIAGEPAVIAPPDPAARARRTTSARRAGAPPARRRRAAPAGEGGSPTEAEPVSEPPGDAPQPAPPA
jgi:glycogen operon protein